MTLQEAIQLAQNGDIGAMMSLGEYYVNQNTGEGITEAAKYYEMAAKKEVAHAIHMTVLCKQMLARAGMQVASQEMVGFLLDDWREVYEWSAEELDCINNKVPGSEHLNINEAIENFEEASYYFALCCFWEDEYTIAKELICDLNDIRSKILYGALLLQMASTKEQMKQALEYLVPIIANQNYATSNKIMIEEDVYALTILQVSKVYCSLGSQTDLEKAVAILNNALNSIKYDNNKQILSEELRRYQKKMFGGYRYV